MQTDISIIQFETGSTLLRAATEVYASTWDFDLENAIDAINQYTQLPGFIGLVAESDQTVLAMGFGIKSQPGFWWHDIVSQELGAAHPALQDAWLLLELCVLHTYRNQEIGGLLHDRLLHDQDYSRALLSTRMENNGARRFYERKGWTYLKTEMVFGAGQPQYAIMRKEAKAISAR